MPEDITPKPTPEETSRALDKIRPELNLEKWSIWSPAKSQKPPKRKVFQRGKIHPDGNRELSIVEIGFTDRGVLTTEDQKTYYALIKIWENKGHPIRHVFLSLRQLAKILNKKWGSNVIKATTESLLRLLATPFVWRNSYYNAETRETEKELTAFHVLSDLKIIQREKDGHITKEAGYFKFHDRILKNLLFNHTKPLYLDVILKFKSEIAQLLYTYLDLIIADKTHYERRTKELFEDLKLEGRAYQNLSNRKQKLEPALKELQGVELSTGILIEAKLEPTQDKKDYKVVFKKKPKREYETEVGEGRAKESVLLPKPDPQVEELVRYFHEKLHHPGYQATIKELDQATSLIAHCGYEPAKYVIDYALEEAQKTKFQMRTFGAIFQYKHEALRYYEERKKQEALLKARIAQAEEERQEQFQRERQEKEELNNLYQSLSQDQRQNLDYLINQRVKQKGLVSEDPSSIPYQAFLYSVKYQVLKEFKENPNLLTNLEITNQEQALPKAEPKPEISSESSVSKYIPFLCQLFYEQTNQVGRQPSQEDLNLSQSLLITYGPQQGLRLLLETMKTLAKNKQLPKTFFELRPYLNQQ